MFPDETQCLKLTYPIRNDIMVSIRKDVIQSKRHRDLSPSVRSQPDLQILERNYQASVFEFKNCETPILNDFQCVSFQ